MSVIKNAIKKVVVICLISSIFFSCTNILEEKTKSNNEYGSLTILHDSRFIYSENITSADVFVEGNGITSEIKVSCNSILNGKGSVFIDNIPVGKNRIITVQAKNNNENIKDIVLYAVVDIDFGNNVIEEINWITSKKGRIYKALLDKGVNVSTLSSSAISKINDSIPDVHASLIDSVFFASDYSSNPNRTFSSSDYELSTANVSFTCYGLTGKSIVVSDPLSSKSAEVTSDGQQISINGISPGTWGVYTVDSDGKYEFVRNVIVGSGDSKSITLGSIAVDGIRVFVAKSLNYPLIHYWSCSDIETYPSTTWPGINLLSYDDNDYYYYFDKVTAVNVLITNSNKSKLCSNDIELLKKGDYRITASGAEEINVVLDTENPEYELFTSDKTGTISGDVNLSFSVTDNINLKKIEIYLDSSLLDSIDISGTSDDGSYTWNSATSKNGNHNIKAIVYDNAGNFTESNSISLVSNNENIVPVAKITGLKDVLKGTTKSYSAASSYDLNGAIVSYKWNVSGATISGSSTSETVSVVMPSSASTVTISLIVTDDDGATGSESLTVNVKDKIEHRDFREETVYFMMTDRFCDGDKTNNNIWGDEYLPNGESDMYTYDESKTGVLSYYHGGDFKGIIDNLDYIKDMGFTAIWITPVVRQCEGRYFYDGSSGGDAYEASAFHGYWGHNFDQIDPHLHSSGKDDDGWDDYIALIDACHEKGIKVMQDIVVNHGQNPAATAPTKWYEDRNTIIMDGNTWTWKTQDPYYSESGSTAAGGKEGFFSYEWGASCAGLIDFNEEGPDEKSARQHLINVYKRFIDAGVDAFRIDTVAYMTADWWGYFADTMYNYAKSIGNDYFYMIGEAWGGRGASLKFHNKDTTNSFHQLDMTASCMDYPGEMKTAFQDGGDYSRFVSLTTSESLEPSAEDSTWMGMFVDNHDVFRCNGVFTETQYKNALTYIYLFRGVPIVYYGTESMYSWSGAHATTNKDDVCARWMLGQVGIDYVKSNTPSMYKHIKMLNEVHSNSPCIQKGAQENISVKGDTAVLKRTYDEKSAYIVISKGNSASYSFTDLPSGTYKKYTSTSTGAATVETITLSGSYTVASPANGFAFIEQQ